MPLSAGAGATLASRSLVPYIAPVQIVPVSPPFVGAERPMVDRGVSFTEVQRAADGDGVEVASRRTPMSAAGIRRAIAGAYRRRHGRNIAPEQLEVFAAHVAHETARGERMFNYNFGGMKGVGPSGLTTRYKTTEVLDGEVKKLVDGFRAYRDPVEGASDYLDLLERRFPSATQAAANGDVGAFSAALKRAGYYTADEEAYTRALRAHVGEARGAHRVGPQAPTALQVRMSQPFAAPRPASVEGSGHGGAYLYGAELAAEGLRLDGLDPRSLPTTLEVSRVLGAVRALDSRLMASLAASDSSDERSEA